MTSSELVFDLPERLPTPVPDLKFADPALAPIWERVVAGERLPKADGLALLETPDILGLGRMADFAKRRVSGEKVYFVLNVQVNPTNICVLSCKFCDFAAKPGDDHAYEMSYEEILETIHPEMEEMHLVGGHHHTLPFEWYEELLRTVRRERPNVQIKAFTAAEIDYFCKRFKLSEDEVFDRLIDAGLQSMPGGGAEVFSDRVRKLLFRGKIGRHRWMDIHHMAHRRGLRTNATLLYGHIETLEERIDHLIFLREGQDVTGGFLAFIPLEYQLGTTRLVERGATAIDDLKMLAVSRLMLDNVPHIKSYWIMTGAETAAIGLNFGADDLDGTIGKERIAHAALAASPLGLERESMARMVRDAGKIPVARNALYREVEVFA